MDAGSIPALVCSRCGTRNSPRASICTRCGRALQEPRREGGGRRYATIPVFLTSRPMPSSAEVLTVLGWLIIALGFVSAIWIMAKLDMLAMVNDYFARLGWLMGLGTLFSATVVGSMCLGIAKAVENTAVIRRRLERRG